MNSADVAAFREVMNAWTKIEAEVRAAYPGRSDADLYAITKAAMDRAISQSRDAHAAKAGVYPGAAAIVARWDGAKRKARRASDAEQRRATRDSLRSKGFKV